jgi:hypothetical protein
MCPASAEANVSKAAHSSAEDIAADIFSAKVEREDVDMQREC